MKKAFTLLELVVVLFLITVLAIMLIPAMEGGHAEAIRVKCLSRMRQVGMAMQMYQSEHAGRWPSARRSVCPHCDRPADATASLACLYPGYASKAYLFCCPATQDTVAFEEDGRDFLNCTHWYVSPAGKATRPEQEGLGIPRPPSYFYDGGRFRDKATIPRSAAPTRVVYGDNCVHGYREEAGGKGQWLGRNNHQNGGNFLFVDKHVELLKVFWTGEPYKKGRSVPYVPNPRMHIRIPRPDGRGYVVATDTNVFQEDWGGKRPAQDADLAGMMWLGDRWEEF